MAPTKSNKVKLTKWYKPDDEKVHFRRKRNTPKAATLRKGVAPG